MNYRIKRGDQDFGPYTLSELQHYVQTLYISPQDLALSEGMNEWIPVSQVLGDIPIPPSFQPAGLSSTVPDAALLQPTVPLPPNLHWGWLLLLNILTRSLFNIIWAFFQANWARKLSGKNTALVLIAMYPAAFVAGVIASAIGGAQESGLSSLGTVLIFAGLICMLIGVFQIRSAMEEYYNTVENIGLSLSGVMTFFFRVIYLQYHINRIARWKKTGVLS